MDEYFASHRHPTNRLTHKVAIPLIAFHLIAMLDWIRIVNVPGLPGGVLTAGMLFWAGASVWYLWADARLAVPIMAVSALALPVGRMLPAWALVAIAATGWLVQLAGHLVWEKKQPSFLTNLVHALVGPLFFVAVLFGVYRIPAAERPAQ